MQIPTLALPIALLTTVLCFACTPGSEPDTENALASDLQDDETTETLCGPQTPRDITSRAGENQVPVPDGDTPTLCNVHFHQPFEHAGFDGQPAVGEATGEPVCGPVDVGGKVEFHWVYTSCRQPAEPVEGLGNCLCDRQDTVLRVYAQSYVVGSSGEAPSQPSGELVRFAGSTTGPSYDNDKCSQLRVNWEVNPTTLLLDKAQLGDWCETHTWGDDDRRPHGARDLVTRPDWLAAIP